MTSLRKATKSIEQMHCHVCWLRKLHFSACEAIISGKIRGRVDFRSPQKSILRLLIYPHMSQDHIFEVHTSCHLAEANCRL